jgi:uncharacterized protein (TIGR00255 family)
MPHSMTGFATASSEAGPFGLVWELRSVNHRFLDVTLRMPEELRSLEPACRDCVTAALGRGKVDCALRLTLSSAGTTRSNLAAAQLELLRSLAGRVRQAFPDALPLSVAEVLRWPGVLEETPRDLEELSAPALACLTDALAALKEARRREGERTAAAIAQRNAAIAERVEQVRPRLAGVEDRHRARLLERLDRLDVEANPERLEQELALILQRLDVSEEIERLTGHVSEVAAVLARDEPVGRRLDFLIQELNREANTFASKVQDEELTLAAVDIKVLIEQMREQVQNLE